MTILSQKWKDQVDLLIADRRAGASFRGAEIDMTLSSALSKRHLICALSQAGLPFRVYQLGCGVARITTDTTRCPCCGAKVG